MRSPVTVRLLADGRIEAAAIATDMGQGAATVLLQMAADAAGVGLDDVTITAPDTSLAPDSGPTVASRTTMIVGETMARAVAEVRDRVLEWWRAAADAGARADRDGLAEPMAGGDVPFRDVARRYVGEVGPVEVTRHHETPDWQVFDEAAFTGSAYAAYSWGADVLEVAVDPDTFETRTVRATVVCEVGTPVHPGLCTGQVEGGTLQAIGYGLMEEIKVDHGRYVNDRLATYIIPSCMDAPVMDVQFLHGNRPQGSAHPKGVGELPIDGGAPALASAIENATGLAAAEIPVTPERLFELARGGR
jgi:CO/xanthine dehydrogenase Mo-binding subunit